MDQIFIAIIDGTGPFRDSTYIKGMKASFCVQLAARLGLEVKDRMQENLKARYERGPPNDGLMMEGRADRAADFLFRAKNCNVNPKLLLAGYSRGASAVVMAAEMLAKRRPAIEIDAMFLFDPVARHRFEGGTQIPANVKEVWRVERKLDEEVMKRYDSRFAKVGTALTKSKTFQALLPATHAIVKKATYVATDWSHPMRKGFGTTAVKYLGSGPYNNQAFIGSHGALGGVGWLNIDEDMPCQESVAIFMNEGLLAFGIRPLIAAAPTEPWTGSMPDAESK